MYERWPEIQRYISPMLMTELSWRSTAVCLLQWSSTAQILMCQNGMLHHVTQCPHINLGSFPLLAHLYSPLRGLLPIEQPWLAHYVPGWEGHISVILKIQPKQGLQPDWGKGCESLTLSSLSLICWEQRIAISRFRFIMHVLTHFITGCSGLLTRESTWDLVGFADRCLVSLNYQGAQRLWRQRLVLIAKYTKDTCFTLL